MPRESGVDGSASVPVPAPRVTGSAVVSPAGASPGPRESGVAGSAPASPGEGGSVAGPGSGVGRPVPVSSSDAMFSVRPPLGPRRSRTVAVHARRREERYRGAR
ncbi:hypothetical protein GCM10022220_68180 [Actinocatenispora rupis]|uniref:Uncharacterized protein n=1 Tax=Actinocatenispora rupis TaxID=519421 RepID=A0A8J3JGY1_9ACTN|nr:hypothetical protein Aru02nite_70860 [Actinocatenispora rupis]